MAKLKSTEDNNSLLNTSRAQTLNTPFNQSFVAFLSATKPEAKAGAGSHSAANTCHMNTTKFSQSSARNRIRREAVVPAMAGAPDGGQLSASKGVVKKRASMRLKHRKRDTNERVAAIVSNNFQSVARKCGRRGGTVPVMAGVPVGGQSSAGRRRNGVAKQRASKPLKHRKRVTNDERVAAVVAINLDARDSDTEVEGMADDSTDSPSLAVRPQTRSQTRSASTATTMTASDESVDLQMGARFTSPPVNTTTTGPKSTATSLSDITSDGNRGQDVSAQSTAPVDMEVRENGVDNSQSFLRISSTESNSTAISDHKNSGEEVAEEAVPASVRPKLISSILLYNCDYENCRGMFPSEEILDSHHMAIHQKPEQLSSTRELPALPIDSSETQSLPDLCSDNSVKTAIVAPDMPVLSGPYAISHSDTSGESSAAPAETTTSANASAHIVTYSQKRFKCDECSQTYGRDRELKQHLKSQHDVREPYRCQECDRRYLTKSQVSVHIRDKHPLLDSRYRCRYGQCERQFASEWLLNNHRFAAHAVDYPYRCLYKGCDDQNGYSVYNILREHELAAHYAYRCHNKGCDRVYDTTHKLRAHRRRRHSRPHSRRSHYTSSHRRTSDGKRQASSGGSGRCVKFGTTASQKRRRNKGVKHVGNTYGLNNKPQNGKAFQCYANNCHKIFKMKKNLIRHQRCVHLNERIFKCNEKNCGKSFGQKAHLITHERIHSGEKPFVCGVNECNKRFSQKTHLKDHFKTHLKIQNH